MYDELIYMTLVGWALASMCHLPLPGGK
jgi:hypothetical protein